MARMGEIIDGKYEVLREIGRGGMSIVYLAMDKRLNKQWAIKEFRKDKDDTSNQVALEALLKEANLMKKLDHPTLPRIVDIIDNNQNVYVIMDYIEGESLNKVLDAYGAQPQEAVIEWAKQLSEVLDYLHTQNPPIIYRDMKPANIMLKPDGTVRLIDFGIAREHKEGKDGDTENIGTRGYAAPEQFGGKGQTDARTDIYSLGVTLYHLVTGKNPAEPPYEIYPIRHWNPAFSSGFEWLIQKCTQLNPSDRYQSCAEVTYVLENLDLFESEYRRKQKNKISLFFTSCIATVVCVIMGIVGLVISQQEVDSKYDEAKKNLDYTIMAQLKPDNKEPYQLILDDFTNKYSNSNEKFSNDEEISAVLSYSDNLQEKDYIRYSYEFGKLYYSSYENEGQSASDKAAKYFIRALASNMKHTEAGNESVLSEYEINRAKAFFLLDFISDKHQAIKDGESVTLTQEVTEHITPEKFGELFDMNVNGDTITNFNEAAWEELEDLVEILKDEKTQISDTVKLESYKRIVNILSQNERPFYKLLSADDSADDFTKLCDEIVSDVNNISDTALEEDEKQLKADIIKNANDSRDRVAALIGTKKGDE